jgi:hypothetical protein
MQYFHGSEFGVNSVIFPSRHQFTVITVNFRAMAKCVAYSESVGIGGAAGAVPCSETRARSRAPSMIGGRFLLSSTKFYQYDGAEN